MDAKGKSTLSEYKVGIFVVIALAILAVAIFTIGTQVGLLQRTFVAKTYLNTVSGLKPGDVVLLGGVEVGNVTSVAITSPGQIPDTPANEVNTRLIKESGQKIKQLEARLTELRGRIPALRSEHASLARRYGPDSTQARKVEAQLDDAEGQVGDREGDLRSLTKDVEQARDNIQNIEVYLEIISEYRDWIKADSNISLGSVGLLGDKYIEISLGRTGQQPPLVKEKVEHWYGAGSRDVVVITGTRQAGFQELITGANDILANFEALSGKLQDIMNQFEQGRGSVGKFFSDPAFYNNLNMAVVGARDTVEKASRMITDITQGPGTVPRLIQDREVYDRIDAATGRLEAIMTKIESGNGTLGKLVNDPALYQNTDQVMKNASGITGRMEAGEGTLGKLSKDEKLYDELQTSIKQLSSLMSDVEQGKGTLGKLAKDDELYQNVNKVSAEMVKLIYDFRQNPKKFLTIKFEIF
jgi:phospholipid/cholesterol/gamma-HCH transport system substrate-binding protein